MQLSIGSDQQWHHILFESRHTKHKLPERFLSQYFSTLSTRGPDINDVAIPVVVFAIPVVVGGGAVFVAADGDHDDLCS